MDARHFVTSRLYRMSGWSRHGLLLALALVVPSQVSAGPILDLLSVSYAITGTGITHEQERHGPDGPYVVPYSEVIIDATSDEPLSAFAQGTQALWYLGAVASGSMDNAGGHLYTFFMSDDEGNGQTDRVSATAEARFVSRVSHLELTLYTLLDTQGFPTEADAQRTVTLYDETLGAYVFRMMPGGYLEDQPPQILWSDYPQPFTMRAQVGHVYRLTSFSELGHVGGVQAGVAITGTPVADGGATARLLMLGLLGIGVSRALIGRQRAADRGRASGTA